MAPRSPRPLPPASQLAERGAQACMRPHAGEPPGHEQGHELLHDHDGAHRPRHAGRAPEPDGDERCERGGEPGSARQPHSGDLMTRHQ